MINKIEFEKNIKMLSEKELYFASAIEEFEMEAIEEGKEGEDTDINLDEIDIHQIVMLVNEQNLERILAAEQKNDAYHGGMKSKIDGMPMIPFYLYYDEEQFLTFLNNNKVDEICNRYRIVILVGAKNFVDFFCQMDALLPTLIIGDEKEIVSQELSSIRQEKVNLLSELLYEVREYYKQNEEEIRTRVLEGTAKICVLKNYFEPVKFKRFYQQMKESLEPKGYCVEICDERAPVFRTPELINIYENRPDIVLQINKARNGRTYLGETVNLEGMENLIYINWIQDIHPAILDEEYGKSLKKNDYIFSIFDKNALEKYRYPDKNIIYGGIMPADKRHFYIHSITENEHAKYDSDLCFVGSIMTDEMVAGFIYQSLINCLNQKQLDRVADELFLMLENIYDSRTGKYLINSSILNKHVERLEKELDLDHISMLNVYRVFCVVRYNSLRKLILKQLADQKKYKIVLYGEYDVGIENVKFGGYISDQDELSKAIQCAKIVMQINPDVTMNQRVAEGLLSNTMAMVFKMDEESDMSNIENYLGEQEGICYFRSKEELLQKCDLLLENDNIRDEITEKGYKKAVNALSTDAVFEHLMNEIKQKIVKI